MHGSDANLRRGKQIPKSFGSMVPPNRSHRPSSASIGTRIEPPQLRPPQPHSLYSEPPNLAHPAARPVFSQSRTAKAKRKGMLEAVLTCRFKSKSELQYAKLECSKQSMRIRARGFTRHYDPQTTSCVFRRESYSVDLSSRALMPMTLSFDDAEFYSFLTWVQDNGVSFSGINSKPLAPMDGDASFESDILPSKRSTPSKLSASQPHAVGSLLDTDPYDFGAGTENSSPPPKKRKIPTSGPILSDVFEELVRPAPDPIPSSSPAGSSRSPFTRPKSDRAKSDRAKSGPRPKSSSNMSPKDMNVMFEHLPPLESQTILNPEPSLGHSSLADVSEGTLDKIPPFRYQSPALLSTPVASSSQSSKPSLDQEEDQVQELASQESVSGETQSPGIDDAEDPLAVVETAKNADDGAVEVSPSKADESLVSFQHDIDGKKHGISAEDIACLNAGELLNDVIISFFTSLSLSQLKQKDPALAEKVHLFNSFLYTRFYDRRSNRAHLESWLSKIPVEKKELVILPINASRHWVAAVFVGLHANVTPENPAYVVILDSLGTTGTNRYIYRRVNALIKEIYELRDLPVPQVRNSIVNVMPDIPSQRNDSDCGVFLVSFLQEILANPEEFVDKVKANPSNKKFRWERFWKDHDMIQEKRKHLKVTLKVLGKHAPNCAKESVNETSESDSEIEIISESRVPGRTPRRNNFLNGNSGFNRNGTPKLSPKPATRTTKAKRTVKAKAAVSVDATGVSDEPIKTGSAQEIEVPKTAKARGSAQAPVANKAHDVIDVAHEISEKAHEAIGKVPEAIDGA